MGLTAEPLKGSHSSYFNHVKMAEEEETLAPVDVDHEDDPNYQPPPEKSIDELTQLDKDDESLQKYKAALLGGAVAGSGAIVVEPDDPRKVIVKKLSWWWKGEMMLP